MTTPTSFFPSNASANLTEDLDEFIDRLSVQICLGLMYFVIFVLGVLGNVLVVFVVVRNPQMQTVTNLFICNLAVGDILLCVLAVPFTPLYTFLKGWVFGKLLCHVVSYIQGVSIYISTLTLTGIAIDRFLVILYPFRPRMELRNCAWIIVTIWFFGLLLTAPYGIYIRYEERDQSLEFRGKWLCEEHWPSEEFRKVFSITTTILQYAIPCVIIIFCYVCVSIKLNEKVRSRPGCKTTRREEVDRERKRRTNRMLISMCMIFGFSWLPLNIVNIVEDYHEEATNWHYYSFCFFLAHALAMSSTCYNPFVYAWLNDNFRKEFKQVLPIILPCLSGTSLLEESRYPTEVGGGRSCDRTCNGNDTIQESLLPGHSGPRYSGSELIPLERIVASNHHCAAGSSENGDRTISQDDDAVVIHVNTNSNSNADSGESFVRSENREDEE